VSADITIATSHRYMCRVATPKRQVFQIYDYSVFSVFCFTHDKTYIMKMRMQEEVDLVISASAIYAVLSSLHCKSEESIKSNKEYF